MLRLILVRHAKAVPHGAAPDFDRALAPRGLEAAAELGRMLADAYLLPDLALVSPSLRTRQTWDEAAKALPGVPVRHEALIYDAEPMQLLRLVQHVAATVKALVVVGHNPGVAELAQRLVGHGDRYAFSRLRTKYVTGGVAVVDFDVETWASVVPGRGRLERYVTPTKTDD